MEKFIEEVVVYCKADTEERGELEQIMNAAIAFVEETTGKQFNTEQILLKQAVKMITSEWFDHRGTASSENLKELPPSVHLQRLLNQIALSSDYAEVEK